MPQPTPDGDLHLDNHISFTLYAISNRLTRLYNAMLRELDITYPQLICLMTLWERSPLTVGDFSRKLELETGSITPLLKRLETQGFISRTRDPADERRVNVAILDKGLALKAPFRELRNRTASAFPLDADVIVALHKSLKRFAQDINPTRGD